MNHTKVIELLTLILKGDDPKSHPDYHHAIRFALHIIQEDMVEKKGVRK